MTNDEWKDYIDRYLGHGGPLLMGDGDMYEIMIDSAPILIKEGLITTYPIERAVETFARVYHLFITNPEKKENDSYMVMSDYDSGKRKYKGTILITPSGRINIITGDGERNRKEIDQYMNKYGYFLSFEKEYLDNWREFYYDKKFDEDMTEMVHKIEYIYHICPQKLKEKILKQGLTPHESKWKQFNYRHRCYFFLKNDKLSNWASHFKFHKKDEPYMCLKIDVSMLPEDMKFYNDPKIENGVYTLQGVPPEAITIIRENI